MAPSSLEPGGRWLTWANALTLLRLACAPLVVCAVASGGSDAALVAGGLFWLAVATDFADGRVARRRGESSPLGGLLDHATDAAFVSLGLAALAWRGAVPAPLPALVALAFAQYAFDSRALAGRPLRASALGRWNGIAYYVLLGIPLTRGLLGLAWPPDGLVCGLGWALVVTTLVSMADRARALLLARRGA
jgi:CDP-diacylglycerol--glycerol-3-phosphate 3-phosphatidyltransferase